MMTTMINMENANMMSEMVENMKEVNLNMVIDLPLSFETKCCIQDKLDLEGIQFIQNIVDDANKDNRLLTFDDVIKVRGQYYIYINEKAEMEGIA